MLDLNVIREQIDGIDKQLVDLFEQRMKLTKEVAEYKIQRPEFPQMKQS
jgi:chorismate mutase / prephenate dehydratase